MRTPFTAHQRESHEALFIRTKLKEAREARGMTQEALATFIYKTRVVISDMERGRIEINAEDLLAMAVALEKPITYFYPDLPAIRGLRSDDLLDDEKEILHFYRKIEYQPLQALARAVVERISQTAIESYWHEVFRQREQHSGPNEQIPSGSSPTA